MKTLLFVPTYNEKENVAKLIAKLQTVPFHIDILFIDDGSPDGTGEILDTLAANVPHVSVIHRQGKQGIGSAHQCGLRYAYEHGYQVVLSMDADFTHRPEDLVRLWEQRDQADVVLGSRYLTKDSLPGWNLMRRSLTIIGHVLTESLLGMPYDATGALRLYRIDRIPHHLFERVESTGYSFFFESLFILFKNQYVINEIPIALPARTYGSSKMDLREVRRSVELLVKTFLQSLITPAYFRVSVPLEAHEINLELRDMQGWDDYWQAKKTGWKVLYDLIASLYRKLLIRPALNRAIKAVYPPGAKLLHAGCGGGEVDSELRHYAEIIPLDISVNALHWYRRVNGNCPVLHASIFHIPTPDEAFDGIYNLGVMEHFTEQEIHGILKEFYRVLKPDATIVLFWPPESGISVRFFKLLTTILTWCGKKHIKLHPEELTRLTSRSQAQRLLESSGFALEEYSFGPGDLYTQVKIVARKVASVTLGRGASSSASHESIRPKPATWCLATAADPQPYIAAISRRTKTCVNAKGFLRHFCHDGG